MSSLSGTPNASEQVLLDEGVRLRAEVGTLTSEERTTVSAVHELATLIGTLTAQVNSLSHNATMLLEATQQISDKRIAMEHERMFQNKTAIQLRAELPNTTAKAIELASMEHHASITSYYKMNQGTCCCPEDDRIGTKAECEGALKTFYTGGNASIAWEGSETLSPAGCAYEVLGESEGHGHWNTQALGAARNDMVPICKRVVSLPSRVDLMNYSQNVSAVDAQVKALLPGGAVSNQTEALNAEYNAYREALVATVNRQWDSDNSSTFRSFENMQQRNLANLSAIVSGTYRDPCASILDVSRRRGLRRQAQSWEASVRLARGCI